jgi:hypothetical protein
VKILILVGADWQVGKNIFHTGCHFTYLHDAAAAGASGSHMAQILNHCARNTMEYRTINLKTECEKNVAEHTSYEGRQAEWAKYICTAFIRIDGSGETNVLFFYQ